MDSDESIRNKILIIGYDNLQKETLIQKLLGNEMKQPCTYTAIKGKDLLSHSWNIDTKYYTASVEFLILDVADSEPDPSLQEHLGEVCEALVFMVDPLHQSLTHWESFIAGYSPSVLLCVGEKTEPKVHEWCLDHGVEFVALDQVQKGEEDEDERFVEKFGVERIIEALHANTWPNMILKKEQSSNGPKVDKDSLDSMLNSAKISIEGLVFAEKAREKETYKENEQERSNEAFHLPMDDLMFADLDMPNEGEEDMEDLQIFEKTLGNLASARARASNLPDNERRELAAQFALSFLEAFGDNDE